MRMPSPAHRHLLSSDEKPSSLLHVAFTQRGDSRRQHGGFILLLVLGEHAGVVGYKHNKLSGTTQRRS